MGTTALIHDTPGAAQAGSDRHAVKVRAWLGGRRVEQGLGAADPDLETTVTMTVAGSQNGRTKKEASSKTPQARDEQLPGARDHARAVPQRSGQATASLKTREAGMRDDGGVDRMSTEASNRSW